MFSTVTATDTDLDVLRKLYQDKAVILVHKPHNSKQSTEDCVITGRVEHILSVGIVLDDTGRGRDTFYPWDAIFRLYAEYV